MEGRKGRRPIEYCYWVVPARFLAGEYPRTYEDRSSRRKLSALLDAGITRFIDLTEEGELKPYAPMLASLSDGTVRYERFAIPDTQVPESMGLTRAILDSIDAEMASRLQKKQGDIVLAIDRGEVNAARFFDITTKQQVLDMIGGKR